MEQKKLDRINALTALSRERELTAEEKAERDYFEEFFRPKK